MNNLKALFQQDEILAAKLFGMSSQGYFDVRLGDDPIDINIVDKKSGLSIYSNAVSEVEELLKSIEDKYKRYPVMYFYGLGNGVLYKGLLHNKTHERIVVVEPNIEIIYIVLHFIDLYEELINERLVLFASKFTTYAQLYHLVSKTEYTIFARTYELHIHTDFYDNFADDYKRINKDFTTAIAQMVVGHGNSIDDVLLGTRQHTENIPAMLEGYPYRDLIKKRHKLMDTAIIVATGPSLDKQLDTLKKYAPYVSVISLDASLPILAKHGIKPDYVTSIERVEATSTFFKPLHKSIDADAYFIVASVTHKQTVKNLKNRRLTLTMRPQTEELMLDMSRFGYLGIGHSTANQAFQLAYVLGHKNIILIGQDLAYAPDGKSHATGHAFAQADEYLYTVAYGGEGEVRTTYVWEKFKNQYEADIENSKKDGITTYNCTEGGARINGAIEKPFLETIEELTHGLKPKRLPDINRLKQSDVEKYLMQAYKRIQKKVATQRVVKQRIEDIFLDVAPHIDEMIALKEQGKVSVKHFSKLLTISKKIDKVKAMVIKDSLRKYIENIVQISIFYQELELAKIALAPSDTAEEKTDKLLEWVIVHKYWLFSIAGGLNADIETTVKASQNLKRAMKVRGILDSAVQKYGVL
ncbi:motility associated factor glycosyltransferase family protein [Campylobacter sp. 19-13652]|uniref:motility associated factor glycosyltransferase family protein n=1 Tax=Campylobacter sp. 19-13652 TaxID=2840180 RepID=UPI0021A7C053|nr:6-hydroxymethylpterin diphosphokinase MptE-like protein [Campylobacter sp. 19-13652]